MNYFFNVTVFGRNVSRDMIGKWWWVVVWGHWEYGEVFGKPLINEGFFGYRSYLIFLFSKLIMGSIKNLSF
ncbi:MULTISPECIES: hypothetical protein [unclassified Kaistella]|uniref:hypothetical protein n=1 Tax=unclassified Kaistella TaxID=2762626 RepID=UPI0027328017|nr:MULTISPECIES: hypothetical protein [unclassified Kaistella]MDP2453481.1 hypothetical protein [Kaistella sp. SH11-4b]MDP2456538.1 hypothetical protein [Kaistella sp. SH40-3]MDP2459294.1 hypothetical protein [Kaistella sp. SH19-2b]